MFINPQIQTIPDLLLYMKSCYLMHCRPAALVCSRWPIFRNHWTMSMTQRSSALFHSSRFADTPTVSIVTNWSVQKHRPWPLPSYLYRPWLQSKILKTQKNRLCPWLSCQHCLAPLALWVIKALAQLALGAHNALAPFPMVSIKHWHHFSLEPINRWHHFSLAPINHWRPEKHWLNWPLAPRKSTGSTGHWCP